MQQRWKNFSLALHFLNETMFNAFNSFLNQPDFQSDMGLNEKLWP
jgi:hypothetical protein